MSSGCGKQTANAEEKGVVFHFHLLLGLGNHERHEAHEKQTGAPFRVFCVFRGFILLAERLSHDSFVLQFWVVAEVCDDSKAITTRLQIVVNLSPMLISNFFHGFKFQDDLFVANNVRYVP